MSSAGPPRTLVAGVGYHDLRDHSVGPLLARSLAGETWPEGVVVEDLSYDPVKVTHRLSGEEPPFDRLVVMGAVRRGRRPGTVTVYRWDRALPDPEEVQARVAEAVTGVIALDNLLVVTAAFDAAPREVYVVEVEPEVEAMGDELTPAVAEGAARAARAAREIATGPGPAPVPEAPLGGFGGSNGHGSGRGSLETRPWEPSFGPRREAP